MLAEGVQRTQLMFRPMVQSDRAFFATGWLRSYKGAPRVRGISSKTYWYFHHRLLERLLARSTVVIACQQGDPDILYGFSCFERLEGSCVLHYLYVKGSRRGEGIGSAILDETLRASRDPAALVWTHQTKGSVKWLDQYCERTGRQGLARLYNPYLTDEATR